MTTRLLLLTTLAAALAACGSVPERNAALDQARARLDSARSESTLAQNAPEALQRAQGAIDRAEQARRDGEPAATVDHLAYLAQQRITIAQEAAASQQAQTVAAGASAESDRMRLALRTQEADTAQRRLQASERENARQGADLAQAGRNAQVDQARLAQADRDAQADQARLAQADRNTQADQARLAQAGRDAQADQVRLARRDERVEGLEQQLKDLNARKTERGIVVTLGDMLFDTGQARLQPEGARSMARLADFMKRNPQRQAAIDGYTDDVGSEASNQALSDRRAQAVQSALVDLGVEPARLRAQGHGEGSPIAPNTTSGGRQSNRRVEIVFAAEAGDLLAR